MHVTMDDGSNVWHGWLIWKIRRGMPELSSAMSNLSIIYRKSQQGEMEWNGSAISLQASWSSCIDHSSFHQQHRNKHCRYSCCGRKVPGYSNSRLHPCYQSPPSSLSSSITGESENDDDNDVVAGTSISCTILFIALHFLPTSAASSLLYFIIIETN